MTKVLDQKVINQLKGLVIDGVDKANSGHPGGAMGSMDLVYILFSEFLKFDPENPDWQGRDRFILSAGHMSMQLYSILYANGWLTLDDLKEFRQFHSKTPGHPENFLTPGVECTTGPLGQGAAMSVGMGVASHHLEAALSAELFNYYTYALLGDGCMQEDVTLGAASLAGHLKLGRLVWFYDRNFQQISGHIDRATSDKDQQIYEGLGWHVQEIDGHDHDAIRTAIHKAQKNQLAPSLIIANTVMAKGAATVEGSHKTHGAPFSKNERSATKEKLGIPSEESFYFEKTALDHYQRKFSQKKQQVQTWHNAFVTQKKNKDFAEKYSQYFEDSNIASLPRIKWSDNQSLATRNAFGEVINAWQELLPQLIGGSADLEPSNMTEVFAKTVGDFSAKNPLARNLAFGVREFPMTALCNGIALAGGLMPFSATFLSFADYSRAALRLGAIQKIRVIHEFTHDSFYLGEDGPTHQPVEHVMSLRLIPDFYMMRPADAQETEAMIRCALTLQAPSALALTRQKLPMLQVSADQQKNMMLGGYTLESDENAEYLLIATGSEVSLALEVKKLLNKDSKKVCVVSLPCWEIFEKQKSAYRESVLKWNIKKRVSLEAGTTLGWQKYTGLNGIQIGIDHFGASAPAGILAEKYGFTASQVAHRILEHSF